MENEKHHVVSYRTYIIVLVSLLILTGLSVLITEIELGPLSVFAALFFATVKTALVLLYFMHLKYDLKVFGRMIGLVLLVFIAVLIITFFDYWFR
jgi:cytochrome c oxidase subunit 4